MYEGLHEPIPSLDGFLVHIGYEGPRDPTVEVLDAVLLATLRSVPFANTDVFERRLVPSLVVGDIYRKVVVERRGGYCFELNALLQAALEAMGFDCHAVACRVLFDDVLLRHRAMVVAVDGTRRLVDAGLAGPIPTRSLALEEGVVQTTSNGDFAFERDGDLWVVVKQGDAPLRTIAFEDRPVPAHDFVSLNFYCSKSDNCKMTEMYVYSLFTEDGYISLFGDEFTEKVGDVRTVTRVTPEERSHLVRERFGIAS